MQKVILLGLLLLTTPLLPSLAQGRYRHEAYKAIDFFHEAGATGILVATPNTTVTMPAFSYKPRLSFGLNRAYSISFSMPLSLFLNYHVIGENGKRQVKLGYEIPISVDLNIGLGSTSKCREDIGFFIGAGFGMSEVSISQLESSNSQDSKIAGNYGHLGFRLPLKNRHTYSLSAYTIWGAFHRKVFGFSVLYSLYKY